MVQTRKKVVAKTTAEDEASKETKQEVIQQRRKPTYEELERLCNDLSVQSHRLVRQLEEVNLENAFRRLDYLFKVVEFSDAFTQSFYDDCVAEIERMVKLPAVKDGGKERR